LRFGQVSTREAYKKGIKAGADHFVSELIWREFFQHVLWYYPNSKRKAIKSLYDNVVWSKNKKNFQAWCDGKTGYPIVDAGMRELNETGFMMASNVGNWQWVAGSGTDTMPYFRIFNPYTGIEKGGL